MDKDWTGNTNSIFKTLGASNHGSYERQREDYYATDPLAARLLMEQEQFSRIWEPACGERHLADEFEKAGYEVRASDLIDRCGNEVLDFLSLEAQPWDGDIITNPPYKYAVDFIYKALQLVQDGSKVCMFLKVQFLEGKERRKLFTNYPPPYGLCEQ